MFYLYIYDFINVVDGHILYIIYIKERERERERERHIYIYK